VAPLSAKDTLELQDTYREALALVEAASLGLGAAGGAGRASSALAVAAALNGRQERALKWAQGALAKAIEAREAGIRWAGDAIRAFVLYKRICRLHSEPGVPNATPHPLAT
jgi:hypothetical protein